jgi:CheY-like chemotaxis protein
MQESTVSEGSKPLIAILNSTQASIDLLQSILENEGFATVSDFIVDFREGRKDIVAFFKAYQPNAVVYDIALPYIQNWRFFKEHVLAVHVLPEQNFIITTTNKQILELLVGGTNSIELVGKPADAVEIIQAVRKIVRATL